jgi:hypothetical protein
MPKFDMTVIKVAQTTHDYTVDAENEKEAEKLVIEVARADVPWEHGDPEIVVDMSLMHKEEDSA